MRAMRHKMRHKRRGTPRTLLVCGLVLAALQFGGCAARPPAVEASAATANGSGEALGIKLLGLRRSAAGYMLDLRYKVVDPKKAAPLLDRKIHPFLLDQETGARLFVPSSAKVGPLRHIGGKPVRGQTYFALFANPGRYLPPGRKVTLVVGERKVPDLVVE